jgi:hypothetical protein
MRAQSVQARRATAYHEAGHAVVTFWLGLRLRSLTIVPDLTQGSTGSCHHSSLGLRGVDYSPSDKNRLRAERGIIVALAGMEAQRRFRPRSVRHYHAWHDYRNAVDLASYFFGDADVLTQFMKFMVARTQHLLGESGVWDCVRTVADALLKQPTMIGHEVEALIRSSLRNGGNK